MGREVEQFGNLEMWKFENCCNPFSVTTFPN